MGHYKIVLGLGLLAIGIWGISTHFSPHLEENAEISQGDRYDFNKSTTTVNRSSDIRDHRTLDSRPLDLFDAEGNRYDFNKSTTTVNHSSDIRTHRTMDSRPYDD